jgi:hypothetical protein
MQEVAASQTAIEEVAASQTAMDEVSASATAREVVTSSASAMAEIAASGLAMSDIAGDQTFMQEVAASQTAMQEVAASQTAMSEIDQVDFAVRAIMCGTTGLDPTNFTDAEDIARDDSAMSSIATDATTMNTLAASQVAMQEVAASQTAIESIGDFNNKNITENTILNSSTATSELQASFRNDNFTVNFGNSQNDLPTQITFRRVLVTSNNTTGDEDTEIDFNNDVGPEAQPGSTFIINEANAVNSNTGRSGEVGFTGIEI